MQTKQPPIGYWIKKVDGLLTNGINDIQSSFGCTRTDWQILNSIYEKEQISRDELTTTMDPFADKHTVNSILEKFKERELIKEEAGRLNLTAKGLELHKACFKKQKEFRQKAMTGMSEQQYQETVLTLQKIAENLTS